MVGPILYDGTGMPHRRRYAPRPEPTADGGPVLLGVDLAEVNNEAVEPEVVLIPAPTTTVEVTFSSVSLETVALATGFSVEELGELGAVQVETPPQDAQEVTEQATADVTGDTPDNDATSPQNGTSDTGDAGAATLAALGL